MSTGGDTYKSPCKTAPHRYDDMLDMPHHVSLTRPHMSLENRAAQFLPFAALTGYDDAIEETARLTEDRMDLDEDRKVVLDEQLMILEARLAGEVTETGAEPQPGIHPAAYPEVAITYFRPDARKSGGSYVSISGQVKKIDHYEAVIVMIEGDRIPVGDIVGLELI